MDLGSCRDRRGEDLSLEEGEDGEDEDQESSSLESWAKLGRGVAPIKGLRSEDTFPFDTPRKGGGTPGPSDVRRVEGGFVSEDLFGAIVCS